MIIPYTLLALAVLAAIAVYRGWLPLHWDKQLRQDWDDENEH